MIRARRIEIGYDELAANEILSFYGEGYSPRAIYKEMTKEGGNHDFFIDPFFADEIKKIPGWVDEYWRDAMEEAGGWKRPKPNRPWLA